MNNKVALGKKPWEGTMVPGRGVEVRPAFAPILVRLLLKNDTNTDWDQFVAADRKKKRKKTRKTAEKKAR